MFEIFQREWQQADGVRAGTSLIDQFRFHDYLAKRSTDEATTFRTYLRSQQAEIEE